MNRTSSTPYKTLFSSTRTKIAPDTTRKAYLNELPIKNHSNNKSER